MIAFLLPLVARLGVPERLQRAAAWIATALALAALAGLLWGAWGLWLGHHDTRIVGADRATATIAAQKREIIADRAAGAAKASRDDTFATNQQDLKEKTDAAARDDSSPLDALFNELR